MQVPKQPHVMEEPTPVGALLRPVSSTGFTVLDEDAIVAQASADFLALAVEEGYSEEQLQIVETALAFATEAHVGTRRHSGEPFILHPIEVASILLRLKVDPETAAAALLHDAVEDTPVTTEDIVEHFGERVQMLVDGVTKLGKLSTDTSDQSAQVRDYDEQSENLRKMFLAMAEDIGVVLIKLADRLHNMRTLDALPRDKQLVKARQTMEIFAPLANRLGIWPIKVELEDLSFRYLQPVEYETIRRQLEIKGRNQEEYVERVIELLSKELEAQGFPGRLNGRKKHIYSIYRKMEQKQRGLDEIYDVLGIRVIVEKTSDCYGALGVVHTLWHPIPGEFDDYIATPKASHYRSLHTAVIGPGSYPLEIQIRTQEMHDDAEYGVAAHWRYKEGRKSDPQLEEKVAWLRQLMEWRTEVSDAEDFVEALKSQYFREQIYVFTPKGDIIELPAGSTPVDFAYRIHTEVGHHTTSAKANDRLVPLTYKLKMADVVEIETSKSKVGPSRDWLREERGYVKTPGAREKIRQWFRRQEREENVHQGSETLEKELKRLGLEMKPEEVLERFPRYSKLDDFLAAIGYGAVSAQGIATKLGEHASKESFSGQSTFKKPTSAPRVVAGGMSNMLTTFATCCRPVNGDPIVGFVTRGRGITVHRASCVNVINTPDQERLLELTWDDTATDNTVPVPIILRAFDRVGLVRDISTELADERINILNLESHTHDNREVTIRLILELLDLKQLSRVVHRLEMIPDVIEAHREASGVR